MIKNPFAKFDFSNPFETRRSRNLFGSHTTPRDWKHGARDIPFGMGAASLYVDGTDGHDSNDGESWKTAKATIQEAVDTADPWTQIFIKAGTYAESVTITDDSIHLIGQSRDSVDIHPPTNNALTISGDAVAVTKLSLFAPTEYKYCANLTGENLALDTIKLNGAAGGGGILLAAPHHTILNNIYASNGTLSDAITTSGTSSYLTISNSIFNLTRASAAYVMYLAGVSKSKIFNNDIGALPGAGGYGIWLTSTCSDLSIVHNNFLSNNTQIDDASSKGTFFENYYSEHSNVDNGFGIAKATYAFTTGTDPRPVVVRNGWLGLSWADADQVGDIKSRNVSMMEFWSDNDDVVTLAPLATNVALPNVTVSNLPSGISIISVTGMIDIREFYNNSANANAINGAALIKVKKSTGAWGTDDVALINIPDNSFPMAPSSIHAARTYVGDNNASSEVDANATYNLRFDGNCAVDYSFLYLRDVATGLKVYFTP